MTANTTHAVDDILNAFVAKYGWPSSKPMLVKLRDVVHTVVRKLNSDGMESVLAKVVYKYGIALGNANYQTKQRMTVQEREMIVTIPCATGKRNSVRRQELIDAYVNLHGTPSHPRIERELGRLAGMESRYVCKKGMDNSLRVIAFRMGLFLQTFGKCLKNIMTLEETKLWMSHEVPVETRSVSELLAVAKEKLTSKGVTPAAPPPSVSTQVDTPAQLKVATRPLHPDAGFTILHVYDRIQDIPPPVPSQATPPQKPALPGIVFT